MDRANHLKQQAEKCRRLAIGVDQTTWQALTALAAECEAERADILARPAHCMARAR
jgi:hypothetical protein